VSENYWRRRFAADPAIIGKTVHLNGIAAVNCHIKCDWRGFVPN
jgi:hypothetical protein